MKIYKKTFFGGILVMQGLQSANTCQKFAIHAILLQIKFRILLQESGTCVLNNDILKVSDFVTCTTHDM